MLVLKIGEPFPLHNKANGQEYCRIEIFEQTNCMFELFYYFDNPTDKYKSAWSKKEFKHGVYEVKGIPFILFQFDVSGSLWQFDVTINALTLSDEYVDTWLNLETKTIRMYLINSHSNILESMAVVSLSKGVAEQIRDICERQNGIYSDKSEIELITREIELKLTTTEMIKRTKMYK